MTRSGQNGFALASAKEGRQGSQLLVAGGDGAYTRRSTRQRTLSYLGELNSSAQACWLKTIEVFNEQGEAQQLKLFPAQAAHSGHERIGHHGEILPQLISVHDSCAHAVSEEHKLFFDRFSMSPRAQYSSSYNC